MPRSNPFLTALCLLFVVACGDDAETGSTTVPATTTTLAEATSTVPPTTTLPEPTTTTLSTGTLIDPFDGSTPAVPWDVQSAGLTWDLGVSGFLTIGNATHPDPGFGLLYAALYPHSFRDGIVTMRFRPRDPSLGAKYSLFLWAAADLADFTEVQLDRDEITVIGWSAGGLVGAATVSFPEGTYDPAGFNELRVQALDGDLEVFLNGISLGAVFHDPAPLHEGRVGFGFRSYQAGSEMTLDEFRIEPEGS